MAVFGVDHAWGRPGISALRKAGVKFVCRYLSHDDTGKNLTRAEAALLSDAGLWIVVVWETAADRALGGHAAGIADAKDAIAQAKACGMPAGRPIYFAVDFDANPREIVSVNGYLDGAASVLGRDAVGVYGGYNVVRAALDGHHCTWAWQTYAWSGGQWDHRAHIQQYSNDHVIGGVGLDYDRAMHDDYGQWKVGEAPASHTGEDPGPGPAPKPQEDEMPYGQLADGPQAITPISLHKGAWSAIGFWCDNGLQGLPPAVLRVAVHDKDGWHVEHVTVDSAKPKPWFYFKDKASTDGVSVRREDDGAVHVAWDAS